MKAYPAFLPRITTTDASKLFSIPDATVHYWLRQGFVSSTTVIRGTKMEVRQFSRLELQMFMFTDAAGEHRIQSEQLHIGEIVQDPEFQSRVKLNHEVAMTYAEAMKRGEPLPPIVVAVLNDKITLIAGHHRLEAAKLAGEATLPAHRLKFCDRTEAYFLSVTSNNGFGLRPTKADRRKSAQATLTRPEYQAMTVPELASLFGYCDRQIQRIRKELLEGTAKSDEKRAEPTLAQRAFEQLARAIAVIDQFAPELSGKLRAVMEEHKV